MAVRVPLPGGSSPEQLVFLGVIFDLPLSSAPGSSDTTFFSAGRTEFVRFLLLPPSSLLLFMFRTDPGI